MNCAYNKCLFCLFGALCVYFAVDCSAQVVNVHLPVDRETGARRPFGFVEFEAEAEADSAVAATSHSIAGRDVCIALHTLLYTVAMLRH